MRTQARPPRRRLAGGCVAALLTLLAPAVPAASAAPCPATAAALSTAAAPTVAEYRVSRVAADGRVEAEQRWMFVRDTDRIVVMKGLGADAIDEIWQRERSGAISLMRVFHQDRRVVDYTANELATLGVTPDWSELGRFVSAQVLRSASCGDAAPAGAAALVWDAERQLPVAFERPARRATVRFALVDASALPGPRAEAWQRQLARSADYLHLDAADFGDMEYDPFVRKAEAVDVGSGLRSAHAD